MKNPNNFRNQTHKGGMQILTYISNHQTKYFISFSWIEKTCSRFFPIVSNFFFFLIAHNLLACFSKHILYTVFIFLVSVLHYLFPILHLLENGMKTIQLWIYAFELDIVFILDLPIKHYLFLPSKNLEPF